MFSGKSRELLTRLSEADSVGASVIGLRPAVDTRVERAVIWSRDGFERSARLIRSSEEIAPASRGFEVVGIDEVQFLEDALLEAIAELCERGIRVVTAGLDLNFRRQPFGPTLALASVAEAVTHLHARCAVCGERADLTQRLVSGAPAAADSPLILIGDEELYEPRCGRCHVSG